MDPNRRALRKKFVGIVMGYAPIGIGAAIAVTVSKSGLDILKNLGMLVGTLYGALIFFVLAVFVPVALLFKVPLRRFIRAVKEPWLIAFTSASSEAALPLALADGSLRVAGNFIGKVGGAQPG